MGYLVRQGLCMMRGAFLVLTILPFFVNQVALGQTVPSSASCEAPLDLKFLQEDAQLPGRGIINDETISETGLTIPSLWWAKEQFDPFGGKLIKNWLAYQQERRIDVLVNRQLWSLLDYIKRYRFVNQMGTVAREYGYNLRIFNQQKKCLATYTCDFTTIAPQCRIDFEPSIQNGFQ